MEGEQFSLCWNNFHSNLSTGFHSLLKDEDLVDCTLAAEGQYLKAHKTVLSVCSPFFKDLFRVNPCKHPIVILPDVNYSALCSLLHFMYQGEVSVSQEEIPTFMRVAETLKVKGLTDNANDTNGYTNKQPGAPLGPNQREMMKRPKPMKKVIRPIQHLRPIGSPSPNYMKSPQPSPIPTPPPKKPHLEESPHIPNTIPAHTTPTNTTPAHTTPAHSNTTSTSAHSSAHSTPTHNTSAHTTPTHDFPESLVKPKEEPIETHMSPLPEDDINMDMSQMLDTQIGEASPSQIPPWALQESSKAMQDSSSPGPSGGIKLIKSGRGQMVLLHNGHIYTLCDKKDFRSIWVCVKKKTLNCEGCVTTLSGPVLLSYSGHNHPQLHEVIQKLQVPSCSVSPELI